MASEDEPYDLRSVHLTISEATVSRVPVAAAHRRKVAKDGDNRPPSSRTMADWVVPRRSASSARLGAGEGAL